MSRLAVSGGHDIRVWNVSSCRANSFRSPQCPIAWPYCRKTFNFRLRCGSVNSEFVRQTLMRMCSFGSLHAAKKPASSFFSARTSHDEDLERADLASSFSKENFEAFLLGMQQSICDQVAEADGSGHTFGVDRWQRGDDPDNGYGITRVMEDGNLLEKAAVNISIVRGQLSEARAKAMSARGQPVGKGDQYFAAALSIVFHSQNPFVPTFRSDIRYFEVGCQHGWFGGGADLTPSYLFEDDARLFHKFYKNVCDKYDSSLYSRCKMVCDNYFFIPSRKEHRGIGGIFFDDLEGLSEDLEPYTRQGRAQENSEKSDKQAVFKFVKDVCEGFLPSFLPIAQRRRTLQFGDRERQWQLLRRGRYLEFNLLYDRGIKFGIDGGRIESIMVSAPPLVAWKYNVIPEKDSPEADLMEVLYRPRDWIVVPPV